MIVLIADTLDDVDSAMLDPGLVVYEYLTEIAFVCTDSDNRRWRLLGPIPEVKLDPAYMESPKNPRTSKAVYRCVDCGQRLPCECTPENVETRCEWCGGDGLELDPDEAVGGFNPPCPHCTPENVECQTCGGLGQVRDYCSSELCDDPHCTLVSLRCPDCTPENVETSSD